MEEFEIFNHVLKKYHGHSKEVVIPKGITELADFAFYGSEELETVYISDDVDTIGSYCFNACPNLKNVRFPRLITYLGSGAFSSCNNIETIELPKRLRSIQKSTFYKCFKLKNIKLSENLYSIDHSAFSYCTSLETIDFPETLKIISDSAFEECESLKEIILPNSLTTLGKRVFFHCVHLQEIRLNADLKEIGEGAFQTHGSLKLTCGDSLFLTSKMFDCNWNLNWGYSFKIKNGDNYVLHDSYLPHVDFKMWKPMAKIILVVNFLETLPMHVSSDKEIYLEKCHELKNEALDFIVTEKRFKALNHALEYNVYSTDEIEPYFDLIKDREEKAKLLAYRKEDDSSDSIDDLFADLF